MVMYNQSQGKSKVPDPESFINQPISITYLLWSLQHGGLGPIICKEILGCRTLPQTHSNRQLILLHLSLQKYTTQKGTLSHTIS
jgi:hypothetical protein